MNTPKTFLLLAFAFLMALSSCTVEKRHYTSGYHVDWVKHKPRAIKESVTEDKVAPPMSNNVTPLAQETEAVGARNETTSPPHEVQKVALERKQASPEPKSRKATVSNNEKPKAASIADGAGKWLRREFVQGAKLIQQTNDVAETNGLAITAFISSLLAYLILGLVLSLLAIILGGIAIKRIKSDPYRWKGKGLAIAAIVIGFVNLVILLVAFSML